jgi:hypothetical protein
MGRKSYNSRPCLLCQVSHSLMIIFYLLFNNIYIIFTYYLSCVSKTTQWDHPKSGKKKTLTGGI